MNYLPQMSRGLSHQSIDGSPVSIPLRTFMTNLAAELCIDSYVLFGGAALDSYLQPEGCLRDVDIAICGTEQTNRIVANLEACNYTLLTHNRKYFVNKTDEVVIILADKGDLHLDINFLEKFSSIGQYDLESLKCSYPGMVYYDRYAVLSALGARTATLIRPMDQENPYLLLSRLLVLSAKYGLSLAENPVHREYISRLNTLISGWHYGNSYHDEEVPAGHYSAVLRSILRAADRQSFALDLAASGSLRQTIPELNALLSDPEVVRGLRLARAESKSDLVAIFVEALDEEDRGAFLRRLRDLRLRRWEQEDLIVAAQSNGGS